jgi:two-component system sensor histidine kinase CiaH
MSVIRCAIKLELEVGMEKRLQNKFTLYSVVAAFIVILIIFSSIILGSYFQVVKRADQILEILMQNDGGFPEDDQFTEFINEINAISAETPYSTRFFYVKYFNESKNYGVDIGKVSSISEEQALTYSARALDKESERGFIDHFRFFQKDKEFGKLLIFVDCSRDLNLHYSLVLSGLVVSLIALVAVALIARILSQKAVEPIVQAYERQKQFITDAGHELKTPLAVIKTNAEVLELTTGKSKWLSSVKNQVNRLDYLVGSLLDLAKLDENTARESKEEFVLTDTVQEVIDNLQLLATSDQKRIVSDLDPNILFKGNAESIQKLISILVENAVKYSDPQTDILVSLKKEERKIILLTKNQASDLKKGNYAQLFDRFYRDDVSRNSQKGGHGIGLTIAKTIVEQHSGTITAYSTDGKTLEIKVVL